VTRRKPKVPAPVAITPPATRCAFCGIGEPEISAYYDPGPAAAAVVTRADGEPPRVRARVLLCERDAVAREAHLRGAIRVRFPGSARV
jgi:hypothetical protein